MTEKKEEKARREEEWMRGPSNETQEIRVVLRSPQAPLKPAAGELFVQDKCSIVTSAAETGDEPGSMPRRASRIHTAKASDPCLKAIPPGSHLSLSLENAAAYSSSARLGFCVIATNKSHLYKAEYHWVTSHTRPKGKFVI